MFTFQFLNDEIYSYIKEAIWHLAIWKISVLVNFTIQKLKSKHLVCVSLSDDDESLLKSDRIERSHFEESLGPGQFLHQFAATIFI